MPKWGASWPCRWTSSCHCPLGSHRGAFWGGCTLAGLPKEISISTFRWAVNDSELRAELMRSPCQLSGRTVRCVCLHLPGALHKNTGD